MARPLPSSTSSSPAAASGLAQAAIKQAMGQGASVAVVDQGADPEAKRKPLRTVAIADGPQRRCSNMSAGRRSGDMPNRFCRWRSWTGRCATPSAAISISQVKRHSPIWRLPTMSSARSPRFLRSARRVQRVTAFCCALGPGQARRGARPIVQRIARAPRGHQAAHAAETDRLAEIKPSAGTMIRQASSRLSHTSANTKAGLSNIFAGRSFAMLPPGRQIEHRLEQSRVDARALLALDPEELTRQLDLGHPETGRDPRCLAGRSLSVPLPDRQALRRRAARAHWRRAAHVVGIPWRAGGRPRLARRCRARRDDRQRDAARS